MKLKGLSDKQVKRIAQQLRRRSEDQTFRDHAYEYEGKYSLGEHADRLILNSASPDDVISFIEGYGDKAIVELSETLSSGSGSGTRVAEGLTPEVLDILLSSGCVPEEGAYELFYHLISPETGEPYDDYAAEKLQVLLNHGYEIPEGFTQFIK